MSSPVESCAHCGFIPSDSGTGSATLKKCLGICGGSVAYCNRDCQRAHYKIHKKVCWKKASIDTITIKHPTNGLDLGLKAYHQKDGFGCSGLRLMFSDHLGEERTRPQVVEFFGEYDPEMGWTEEGLTTIDWDILTSPVHDVYDRARLKVGEAVFNTSRNKVEVDALIEAGIITDTGKQIKIGMYNPHPVCRINIPVYIPPPC